MLCSAVGKGLRMGVFVKLAFPYLFQYDQWCFPKLTCLFVAEWSHFAVDVPVDCMHLVKWAHLEVIECQHQVLAEGTDQNLEQMQKLVSDVFELT
jgi:hypothetical protein